MTIIALFSIGMVIGLCLSVFVLKSTSLFDNGIYNGLEGRKLERNRLRLEKKRLEDSNKCIGKMFVGNGKYIDLDTASEKEIRKALAGTGSPSDVDSVITRRHLRAVKQRTFELCEFSAYQQCPQCEVFDYHLMELKIYSKVHINRICNQCGYKWDQS